MDKKSSELSIGVKPELLVIIHKDVPNYDYKLEAIERERLNIGNAFNQNFFDTL